MTAIPDPETLIATWLKTAIVGLKVWADPRLPPNERFTAPITHLQRAPSLGASPLTLDDVQLDADTYAAEADHARDVAGKVWKALLLDLPLTTLPGGIFVKHVSVPSPPRWTPDPKVYRRSASYRVVLHGYLA